MTALKSATKRSYKSATKKTTLMEFLWSSFTVSSMYGLGAYSWLISCIYSGRYSNANSKAMLRRVPFCTNFSNMMVISSNETRLTRK